MNLHISNLLPLAMGLVLFTLVNGACSTSQTMQSAATKEPSSSDPEKAYEQKIEHFSAGDSEYSGFYNKFEYKATVLNSEIRDTLLTRQKEYYQWDREKETSEREKADKEKNAQTDVFLSFFTPDRKNDNLTDSKSIWRIYLDAGGQRYQGKVRKVRSLLAELQVLYPYHTRWGTAYYVTFPVPTSKIETQNAKLTITGPLGTRAIDFSAL